MTTYIVLTDGLSWSQPSFNPLAREHRFARRGEEVEISDDVYETLSPEQRAALGTADDLAEVEASEPAGWVLLDHEAIAAMTVEQVHAYVGGAPEELHAEVIDQVIEVEESREKPRAGVLQLAGGSSDDDPQD